jgi:predicted outer membrane protein
MSRQNGVRRILGIAVAVAASAVAIAAPQQTQSDSQQPQQQSQIRTYGVQGNGGQENRGMAGVGRADLDHYLVKVLIQANKDEIEMGNLAEQRSQNADVKQLAKQMVQDHTGFLNKLESLKGAGASANNTQTGSAQPIQGRAGFRGNAPEGNAAQGANQQQTQQDQNDQNLQQQPQAGGNTRRPGFAGARAHRERMAGMGEHGTVGHFAKIMEEVDRNLQQSMVRELSSKQGAQFDRCYLTGQLFGHMWVIEALKTFERDASPQLKPVLQEGLQASEQHLNHIKGLLAKLDNGAETGSRIQPRIGGLNR